MNAMERWGSSRRGRSWADLVPAMCLVASLGASAAPALPPGTEALSEIDSLVVVYPSGEGEDVATNALSAGRRAGFLTSLFGISV